MELRFECEKEKGSCKVVQNVSDELEKVVSLIDFGERTSGGLVFAMTLLVEKKMIEVLNCFLSII